MSKKDYESIEITIYGLVQGIGFRPFVAEMAEELGIDGTVCNIGGVVKIHAGGTREALDEFVHRLSVRPPAGARIQQVLCTKSTQTVEKGDFRIISSKEQTDPLRFLPPDMATCENCLRELFDPKNRRYRYPFISCTVCGPRFSIIEHIPYDRENTAMREFALCRSCQAEYVQKGNIRRHAQTIACEDCGPRVRLIRYEKNHPPKAIPKELWGEQGIKEGIRLLRSGKILAVKDIGGYHFAFDPFNSVPARRLRDFKNRENKPFAVMFASLEQIRDYCQISETEADLLSSEARPIVLLEKKGEKDFVPEICGDSGRIGAFLPCNPLQYLLLNEISPLVMTSGNRGGEPIITEDQTMRMLMEAGIPDAVLAHDRRIVFGLDDSIIQVVLVKGQSERTSRELIQFIRRARGYVPEPVPLPEELSADIYAAGGDLKAVFALGRKNMAYLSGHFGDLEDLSAKAERRKAIGKMRELLGIFPQKAVCDKHPGYVSAQNMNEDLHDQNDDRDICQIRKIQHHHAHIGAVIAEYGLEGPVLGIAYDGTGYGEDGSIWGGEFLWCEGKNVDRAGHLDSIQMTGGDSAALKGTVAAYCFLYEAVQRGYLQEEELMFTAFTGNEQKTLHAALKHHVHTVSSSSMGRLFDAAAAILEICVINSYEGEAPQRLETFARRYQRDKGTSGASWEQMKKIKNRLCFPIYREGDTLVADSARLMAELFRAKKQGVDVETLAYLFHVAVAEMTVDMCCQIRKQRLSSEKQTGRDIDCFSKIALGGGTMYNVLLLQMLLPGLEEKGFEVYINEKVPCGDGGLAYGQLYLMGKQTDK